MISNGAVPPGNGGLEGPWSAGAAEYSASPERTPVQPIPVLPEHSGPASGIPTVERVSFSTRVTARDPVAPPDRCPAISDSCQQQST